MAEADVAPQGEELPADAFYHLPEKVGAYVGFLLPEDILRGAVLYEFLQDGGDAPIMGAGVQLAVGKGARAPFAELDVGGGVQGFAGPEPLHVRRPLLHRASPLQDDGGKPGPGQKQGGKQPRGTHAHHHGGQGGGTADLGEHIGFGGPEGHIGVVDTGEQPGFVRRFNAHCAHIAHILLLPGVHGAAQKEHSVQGGRGDPQQLRRPAGQILGHIVQGKGEILYLYHVNHRFSVYHSLPRRTTRKMTNQ